MGRTVTAHEATDFASLGVDLAHVRLQETRALNQLKRMTDYAYAKRCRRSFVLRYFGEQPARESCGHCDVCSGSRLTLKPRSAGAPGEPVDEDERYSALAFEELRKWRRQLAQTLSMAPYLVFNDATLKNLAAALPTTREEFLAVKGTGESRWERFGPKVTQVSVMARAAGEAPQLARAVRARRRR